MCACAYSLCARVNGYSLHMLALNLPSCRKNKYSGEDEYNVETGETGSREQELTMEERVETNGEVGFSLIFLGRSKNILDFPKLSGTIVGVTKCPNGVVGPL